MTSHKEQQAQAFAPFDPWAMAAMPMLATSAKFSSTLCSQAIEVASELTDFTMRRMQEEVHLPQRLMQCRTPQELQRTWLDYWKTAMSQYQGEWSRLAVLGRESLQASLPTAELEKRHEERRIAA
jgi:hypothetical protein